uniref:Uncharacterized protein n=1 Tax=Oryza glaberrima TaxID=4538 RepID=I1R6Q2_ORYGL
CRAWAGPKGRALGRDVGRWTFWPLYSQLRQVKRSEESYLTQTHEQTNSHVVKFALARGASLLHRQAVKCVLVEVQVRLGGSLLFSGHLGVSVLLFNFIARFGAGLLEFSVVVCREASGPIVGTWKLLEEERVPVLR